MRGQILGGTLAQPLDPDKPLQQVNVEDLSAFAAMAFENPGAWLGREVELAGDELTMPEVAETMSRVTGREISYYQVPWYQFREQMGEEFAVMYAWFSDVGTRRISPICVVSIPSSVPSNNTSAVKVGRASGPLSERALLWVSNEYWHSEVMFFQAHHSSGASLAIPCSQSTSFGWVVLEGIPSRKFTG